MSFPRETANLLVWSLNTTKQVKKRTQDTQKRGKILLAIFCAYNLKTSSCNRKYKKKIHIQPLFTLGVVYSRGASGTEQTSETSNSN